MPDNLSQQEMARRILEERGSAPTPQGPSAQQQMAAQILAERERKSKAQEEGHLEPAVKRDGRYAGMGARAVKSAIAGVVDSPLLPYNLVQLARGKEGFSLAAHPAVKRAGRYAGMGARAVGSGVVGVADIPMLPYNLVQLARGKEGFSFAHQAEKGFDKLTGDRFKPEGAGEDIGSAIVSAVSGLNPAAAIARKAATSLAGRGAGVVNPSKVSERAAEWTGNRLKNIENAYAPSLANKVGAGTGAAAFQGVMQDEDPNIPSAMLASVAGSLLGHSAVRAVKNIPGKEGRGLHSAGVAIRHPVIGADLVEDLANVPVGSHAGTAKTLRQAVESSTPDSVGEKLFKQQGEYHAAKSKAHEAQKGKLDKASADLLVNVDKPIRDSLSLYYNVQHPLLKDAYLKSPLGIMTGKLLGFGTGKKARNNSETGKGVPNDSETAHRELNNFKRALAKKYLSKVNDSDPPQKELNDFKRALEAKHPPKANDSETVKGVPNDFRRALEEKYIPSVTVSHKDALALRQLIQNLVSSKEWGRYGDVDAAQLKKLRHGLKDEAMNVVREQRPDVHEGYQKFNRDYREYKNLDEPFLSEAKSTTEFKPRTTAEASLKDLHTDAYQAEAAMRAMGNGENRQDLALFYIHDLGMKDGQFSPAKFYDNFHNKLKKAGQDVILHNLTPEVRDGVEGLLKGYKNYKHISNASDEFGDVLLKKQGIDWKSKVISWGKGKHLENFWAPPEKRKQLLDVLTEKDAKVGSKSYITPEKMGGFRRAITQAIPRGITESTEKKEKGPLKVRITP